MSSGQRTLPGSHTRERSFRSRSTIMTCSAASFSDSRSSPASPAGRVTLIGIVQTRGVGRGGGAVLRRGGPARRGGGGPLGAAGRGGAAVSEEDVGDDVAGAAAE